MVVSMPRKGLTRDEPPDMVRVQLKPNDIRSYRRRDAEELLAAGTYPDAFIIGEQADDAAEVAEPSPAKAQRQAPNKARTTRSAPPPAGTPAPVETKAPEPTDAPTATPPAETKSE